MNFFWLFGGSQYGSYEQTKRHTSIPDGKSKFWYQLIVGWVPIFWEVRGKSIAGDLDVDDEGSEQRRFEPVQSLYQEGYVPASESRTQVRTGKNNLNWKMNY
jgi:hypothetical protein